MGRKRDEVRRERGRLTRTAANSHLLDFVFLVIPNLVMLVFGFLPAHRLPFIKSKHGRCLFLLHHLIFTKTLKFHFFFFWLFVFSRAASVAYGGSQARGLIGAIATGLCQSHSNAGSESHLQPTLQLMAMPDP